MDHRPTYSLAAVESAAPVPAHLASMTWIHGSDPVETDADGQYQLVVEFDAPRVCDAGTYDLGIVVPSGYEPVPDDFEPLQCVETVQYRDLALSFTGRPQ